jgi:hypothetical protein
MAITLHQMLFMHSKSLLEYNNITQYKYCTMKKNNFVYAIVLVFLTSLFACSPQDQKKRYTRTDYIHHPPEDGGGTTAELICESETGPECKVRLIEDEEIHRAAITTFFNYYEASNLSGYFQNEPWRLLFSPVPTDFAAKILSGQYIIVANRNTNGIVIYESSGGNFTPDNVIYLFKIAPHAN